MGLHDSSYAGLEEMRGLHLFHFVLSNCSQRVRIALEEKGLAWTSHHMDLPGNEHVTSEYRKLNPNGVVPTLVHDGLVVIESNDILAYLDEHFPDPPLCPVEPAAREAMEARLALAGATQGAIKVLSHELLFRPFRKVGSEELALYESQSPNRELVEFLRDYAEEGPAWQERVAAGHVAMQEALDSLEVALSESPWLSGPDYGLADISWIVNAHRLTQAGYELVRWPRFSEWAARASARPAFDRAVAGYRP